MEAFKHGWLRTQGQTVVVVPCWWDGSTKSLQNTIKFLRPELLNGVSLSGNQLISFNASDKHFKPLGPTIPEIGELMLASFPSSMAVSEILSASNPWWLGEKYDGIRACWHAKRNQLYGRYGVPLEIIEVLLKDFGKHYLDGEIWFGRGNFTEAQKVLSPDGTSLAWEFFRIVVFDDPSKEHTILPFEKRYANITAYIPASHPFLLQAFRILSLTNAIVGFMSHEIIDSGGEGILLRKRGSVYTSGRSQALLKLKSTRGDKEGLVIDLTSDGSLVLQLADGSRLTLPQPELLPSRQIKVGDIATFTYEYHARIDTPINPQITRIRQDLTWRDVLRDHVMHEVSANEELAAPTSASKPFGFWVHQKRKNMRLFFEQYARSNNFNPLVPEDWYSMSSQTIMKSLEGNTVLSYYNGSLIRALVQLFPEVQFDESKFCIVPHKYWQIVANRRKFFLDLAKAKGFDPLVVKNWYSVSEKAMLQFKGANSVAKYYNSSISKALLHLFPELHFNREAFSTAFRTSWQDIKKRRAFFERIAADRGFDPLVPSNWYPLSFNTFNSYQGANTIRKIYGGFKSALCQLFPTIRIDRTKFVSYCVPSRHWKDRSNSKEFFETFAKEKGFDSLKPENWYSFMSKKSILDYKGGVSLMKFYGGFGKALLINYPNIGLDVDLLPRPANYWADRANRQKLFMNYANEAGFDPLIATNWYSITKRTILSIKGTNSMLVRYVNSHIRALIDTFPDIGLQRDLFVGISKKV